VGKTERIKLSKRIAGRGKEAQKEGSFALKDKYSRGDLGKGNRTLKKKSRKWQVQEHAGEHEGSPL